MNRSWTMEQLKGAVASSQNMKQVLELLKLKRGNHQNIDRNIQKNNIDISHWIYEKQSRANTVYRNEYSLEEVFCENSYVSPASLRRKVLKYNIIPYVCECGNEGEWQSISLTLQLDHKNGINTDNRKENLRFLCPNCHSQTLTYSGKNKARPVHIA